MDRKERFEYFWKQVKGEVLAEELPYDYIISDSRIYCANENCRQKNRCELYQRYVVGCKVAGREFMRTCIEDEKGPMASFGMCPQVVGTIKCKYYINKGVE